MHESSARLREARLKAGFPSARAAAIRYGWTVSTYSSHENGQTPVPVKAAEIYAPKFKVSAAWILTGDPTVKAASLKEAPRPPVPVLGAAAGQKGADFLVRDDIQETVPRPAGIGDRANVYALYVTNESMEPRYKSGDLIFVQAYKTPRPGDDAVFQISQGPHDQERSGYVKTFIRKTSKKWICEQYNPKKPVEFDVGDVISVDRVIPWKELLG